MWLRSPPNAAATWEMLLQLQKHLQAFANWTETLPSSKSRDTGDFENWRISNFKDLMTLTLDRVIPSCITHRPPPTYQISSESEKLFVDGCTDGHLTHVIRSTLRSRPNKETKIEMMVNAEKAAKHKQEKKQQQLVSCCLGHPAKLINFSHKLRRVVVHKDLRGCM